MLTAPTLEADRPAPDHYRLRLALLLRECGPVAFAPEPPARDLSRSRGGHAPSAAQLALPLGGAARRVRARR